ncbi:MAG: DUF177 domain-containing protein [Candidatus Omnitrophica bacterium]|nr:DUF177 domain-containing protein [Candidatus Omnitrophota bacterium]
MKIHVKDIRPEGLELTGQIAPELIGLTSGDELYFTGPLDVRARVNRVEGTVLAKTRVHGRYTSVCGRCLVEIREDWAGDFLFDYPIGRDTEAIELDDDIRQEVLLNLPPKVLCKPDCQGICPGCGVDLNNETCKCK